uniref:Uncharacterized protein n=1 Tax=Arundo donax TaxID=35708 RepID=A0A0A9BPR9_ARUDO
MYWHYNTTRCANHVSVLQESWQFVEHLLGRLAYTRSNNNSRDEGKQETSPRIDRTVRRTGWSRTQYLTEIAPRSSITGSVASANTTVSSGHPQPEPGRPDRVRRRRPRQRRRISPA